MLGATETCPFCGNALILSGKIRRQAEPDFIIPFTLDRGDFMDKFRKSLADLGSVPDEIIREIRPENMQARYIPFWLYDVRAEGKCSFKNPRREDRRWTFLAESSAELEFRDVTQDATTELVTGFRRIWSPMIWTAPGPSAIPGSPVLMPESTTWMTGKAIRQCGIG
ncbi:MAG: hypothetical protein VZR11_05380 [Succinimonas sp.]|nr:hypothetical protein [Succinimonas sp.]